MNEELEQLQAIYDTAVRFLVESSFQLLTALIIIAIGAILSRKVGNLVESAMVAKDVDVTLSRFTGNTIQMILFVLIGVIALGQLGKGRHRDSFPAARSSHAGKRPVLTAQKLIWPRADLCRIGKNTAAGRLF